MHDKQDPSPESGGYQVGYGRPPLHSRFKPGQSGNARGRPRRKRGMPELLDEVLSEKMWVTVKSRRKRVSVQVGILYRLREQALKGDHKAIRTLLQLRAQAGDEGGAGLNLHELLAEDQAILASAGLLKDGEEVGDGSQ
jgi:hypothetical protein